MSRHAREPGFSGDRRQWGSAGLLVLASATLALVVLRQSMASPDDLPAGFKPVGDTRIAVPHRVLPAPSVKVSRPELVLNSDGSAALSASLVASRDEVALVSVQIVHLGSTQAVSSTDMSLPIIPGIDAIVGAASDAGGFAVPSGLKAGDVADVIFVFDDQTCVSIGAQVVQRGAGHASVFPKIGSQLSPARRSPNSLTPTCS